MIAPGGIDPDAPFPLSRGQQALYFLHQLVPDTSAYHCIACARITTAVDVGAFERAVKTLVQRHPMLRATFGSSSGTPEQRTRRDLESGFELVDATTWSERQVDEAVQERLHRPFDLERGPVYRICLLRRAEESLLLLVVNHLAYDGISSAVVLGDLNVLYACERDGGEAPARRGREYRDFVRWQEEFLASEEGRRQFEYWRAKLDQPPVLDLSGDHPRRRTRLHGSSVPLRFGAAKNEALYDLARERGVTLNMLLLAAFQILLQRYTGQDDILVGAPAFGRTRPEFQDIVGYFINPIVFRVDLGGNPRFDELLSQVRQEVIASLDNQDYPFPVLVDRLHPQRDPTRNPLFQVMIDWQKREWLGDMVDSREESGEVRLRFNMGELVLEDLNVPQQEGLFDLTLDVRELGKTLHGELKYDANLFERATIERMEANLQTLLDGILADPGRRIGELPLVSADERRALLATNERRAADHPRDRPWHEVFAGVAAARPDAPAATFGDETLSYGELNRRANRLARHLSSLGAGAGVLVGLSVERSLDMLVSLLAIHKAGAAYVPLDPAYPPARIGLILEDADAALLVTTARLRDRLPERLPRLVLLDADAGAIASNADGDLPPTSGPRDLAYVIFTSGSTGRPKGVEIEHRALLNLLSSMAKRPGFAASDVLVAVTTISFDIAGLELYLPLVTGGRVVIAGEREASDGRLLGQLLTRSGATVLQATPATWRLLLEADWSDQGVTALCGGEALPRELAERLLPRCAALWNMYGPTETTIWSLVERVRPGAGAVPIGAPIDNTEVYVLDGQRQLVPLGVPGRLYLGGEGLARGYRKRPDLSAEKFVPHPFSTVDGARLYDTGDRARFRSDGSLEFLGRVDHQVKINGFRIETGEIECVLAEHESVRETVVVARADKRGDARLAAYLVAGRDPAPSRAEVQELLRRKLPAYMVPADLVWLDRLPRTPNGKVDRAALPAPEPARADASVSPAARVVGPDSPAEELLIRVWREVLELDEVGVFDDFFDLGGNSLLSLKVVDRVERETGVRMNPAELVHQTVRQIATRLNGRLEETRAGASASGGLLSRLRRILPRRPRRRTR